MVPRRNPELVIAVLQEHGDWGSNSAHIAAAMVVTYVNKKRKLDHNLLDKADNSKPVEVGAVWSDHRPGEEGIHAGHFQIDPSAFAAALVPAMGPEPSGGNRSPLPAWLRLWPAYFKEGRP
jgi:penicillin-binding protein 2